MTELTRARWEEARVVGDIARADCGRAPRRGSLHRHGARRLGDLGPVRWLRRGVGTARRGSGEPPGPPGQLLLPLPLRGILRAGGPGSDATAGRAAPCWRSASPCRQEGRPVLDAMVWSVGEVEGLEHEDVDPPDVPDPDALPTWADICARRGPAPHALLGQLRPAPHHLVEAVASARPAAADLAHVGARRSRRPPSTILGWMRRARSLCSTWGAGPPAHGRTCTRSRPTSRRAWTSTPRSSTRGARRTGCCSTPTRRWPTAGCCRGPAECGRGSAGCRQWRRPSGLPAHVTVPRVSVGRVPVHPGQNAQHDLVGPGADGVEPGVAEVARGPVSRPCSRCRRGTAPRRRPPRAAGASPAACRWWRTGWRPRPGRTASAVVRAYCFSTSWRADSSASTNCRCWLASSGRAEGPALAQVVPGALQRQRDGARPACRRS